MEGTGQESYLHACDLCFLVYTDAETGCPSALSMSLKKFNAYLILESAVKMQAAVCDGDTIGHPCCAVHDCKSPLINHQHKFCAEHAHLSLQCAITDCSIPHEPGYRTCAKPDHRALETSYFKHGKALFQLRARLKKAGISTLVDSTPTEPSPVHDDDEVVIETADCSGKPEGGNQKLRALFGRRRTHNEQIIMRPCGIILSRATFFGSEAISAVNVCYFVSPTIK